MISMRASVLSRSKRPPDRRICKALSIVLIVILAQTFLISSGRSQLPTHSVFVEIFTSTWCEPCKEEQQIIQRLSTNSSYIAHFVVFHLQDNWSTTDAVERATELGFNFVPSHVYDGGFTKTSGSIINASEIASAASRSVHLVELTVTKTINGNVLNAQVAVAERNGYPFNGEVDAYVVENGIIVNGVQWNCIYKAQVIRQGVYLRPNSYQIINGNWSIPLGSKTANLAVIAAAFDKNSVGKYGPYAIQSTSDGDSNLAIPEFDGQLSVLVASLLFMITMILRRAHLRRPPTTSGI
jgi:thiol-disulfide isomerase/thioredoxin